MVCVVYAHGGGMYVVCIWQQCVHNGSVWYVCGHIVMVVCACVICMCI